LPQRTPAWPCRQTHATLATGDRRGRATEREESRGRRPGICMAPGGGTYALSWLAPRSAWSPTPPRRRGLRTESPDTVNTKTRQTPRPPSRQTSRNVQACKRMNWRAGAPWPALLGPDTQSSLSRGVTVWVRLRPIQSDPLPFIRRRYPATAAVPQSLESPPIPVRIQLRCHQCRFCPLLPC
jgi:hypothetical protein